MKHVKIKGTVTIEYDIEGSGETVAEAIENAKKNYTHPTRISIQNNSPYWTYDPKWYQLLLKNSEMV